MLFNSLEFLIFLPIVLLLHTMVAPTLRWVILLVCSYVFYMSWQWEYGGLMLATTSLNYTAGIFLERFQSSRLRKLICFGTVGMTLAILFVFKYLFFVCESVAYVNSNLISDQWLQQLQTSLILPVGISFYTFQTLSYTIDVYRRQYQAVSHFGKFALYISFFPQLVAGPIERPQNLFPQLLVPTQSNPKLFVSGLRMILWGMIKKVVIADHLAMYVNAVYNNPESASGLTIPIATMMFSVQIYCDFSGYSDIAIGAARLLGVQLMENFRTPYFACSVQEFWRRWHISLSTWFRDYLYIPLGGNRCSALRQKTNLLLTFVVSGLWHGAAWTFVVWGAIHGTALVVEQFFRKRKIGLGRVTGWLITMLFINVTWMFFRANQLQDVGLLTKRTFDGSFFQPFVSSVSKFDHLLCFLLPVCLFAAEWTAGREGYQRLFQRSVCFRFSLYLIGVCLFLLFGVFSRPSEFIYFQF